MEQHQTSPGVVRSACISCEADDSLTLSRSYVQGYIWKEAAEDGLES